MNPSNYILILSVSISHSYFHEKIDSSLKFQPSALSKALMSRFRIVFRQSKNGLELYGPAGESIEVILEAISHATEITSFDFDFNSSDPNFYVYTELPIDWAGQLVYSSDNELNRTENEHIILYPSFIERQNETRLGQLRIEFIDLLRLSNTGNPASFHISFNSRSTQWQYYIINKGPISSDTIYINNDADIQFDGPVTVTLQNGEEASLFTSKILIPLSDVPKHIFNLINNGGEIILRGLPQPNKQQISISENTGNTIVSSPMYVYI